MLLFAFREKLLVQEDNWEGVRKNSMPVYTRWHQNTNTMSMGWKVADMRHAKVEQAKLYHYADSHKLIGAISQEGHWINKCVWVKDLANYGNMESGLGDY